MLGNSVDVREQAPGGLLEPLQWITRHSLENEAATVVDLDMEHVALDEVESLAHLGRDDDLSTTTYSYVHSSAFPSATAA